MDQDLEKKDESKFKTFEEFIPELEILLNKRRHKWSLVAIQWLDFDDIKQQIMLHIFKKFHLFDQSQPFAPWATTIINNQLKNLQRNLYYSCARPCVQNCAFNEGADSCGHTKSGKQDSSCPLFKKWELKKKSAYDLRLPVSQENHQNEVFDMPLDNFNLEKAIENFHLEMKKILNITEWKLYYLLYVEKNSEEEVAKKLGYYSQEKCNRKPGYNSIIRIKKRILQKVNKVKDKIDFY